MTDGLDVHLRVLGADLIVTAIDPGDHAGLSQAWSRCVPEPRVIAPDTARLDALDPVDSTPATADAATDDAITEWALAEAAGRFVLLHACGLSNTAGGVMALVGRSSAGKTTAALTLGRALGYVSDEVVAVRADGSVEAFPRPLGVVAGQWPTTKTRRDPDQLGLQRCPDELHLRRVVVLDRDDLGGEEPTVTPLTLTEALLAVIPRCSYLAALERPLCTVTAAVARTMPVRLSYREIDDTKDLLSRLLEEPPTKGLDWGPEPATSDDETSVLWALRDGRVRRRPFVDAIRTPDQTVLLVDRTPVVLDGVGPTIWRAAGGAPTMAELLTAVEAEHGPHPDAANLVEKAVEDLTDNGVLGFHRPLPIDVLRGKPQSPADSHDHG